MTNERRSARLSAAGPDEVSGAGPDREPDERGMSAIVSTLMFAGVWLVFLTKPVHTGWTMDDRPRGLAGVVVTIAFGVVYLVHFNHARRGSFGPVGTRDLSQRPRNFLLYAVLVALAVAATVLVGQDGTATWVFVAVAGCWTFRLPVALLIGVGLMVAYELLAWRYPGWERDASLAGSILLAMIAVTGAMLAGRRQAALQEARRENARLAVQEERNRVARDLHDILGHSLTVITVKAELAGRLFDANPERARAEVSDLERLSRDALADVRRAVEGYREISLAGELARAREGFAAADIEADIPKATDEVASDLRELFAWTVREAVTNVIRHSAARHVTIILEPTAVTVRDDGRGPLDESAGNGLRGLRERAIQAGAVLTTRTLEPGFELNVQAARRPTPTDLQRTT